MMIMRRLWCFAFILLLLVCAIGVVQATTESLNVEAGQDIVFKINVAAEDRVQLTFETADSAYSNLSFSMVLPNSTFINLGEVGQYSTSFTSEARGILELHFDNTNSSEPAFVALDYEIQHYILGVPEMIFVLAAIAVLLMTIVAGYVIMGKYS